MGEPTPAVADHQRKPRSSALGQVALTPLARDLLRKRLLRKDDGGSVVETPSEMFWRVARHVAGAEEHYGCDMGPWADQFYAAMVNLHFLPNSPTLANAGTELGQLSACFVLPVEDSLEGIFIALAEAALIHKTGGGTGFSFSRLRPKGDVVASTSGVASGPVSFMRVFNGATEAVKQGGRRRGANMGVLRVNHPDILEFIRAKNRPGSLENFSLSVAVNSGFMERALAGEEYDLVNPRTGQPVGKLNARRVLEAMAQAAWRMGEPGLLFLDAVNRANPTPQHGQIEATNPCGEQPLLPYESCNLGSINLARMAGDGEIDWRKLLDTARLAVRFLDDVIDVNRYPLPEVERVTKGNRKIGLGVMGFADLLYTLGVPYDSDGAVELAEQIMREISAVARGTSEELAEERGPFPNFPESVYDQQGRQRIRNATRTTVAPAGTISLIAGGSSGIEPNFALAYRRKVGGEEAILLNPVFERVARTRGLYRPDLVERLLRHGSRRGIEGFPEEIRRVFVTAHDIAPEWHVKVQAALQRHTDNAVSKTVNLPASATVAQVQDVFVLAWKLGCKGITAYRDGSRPGQVLSTHAQPLAHGQPRERPERTVGVTKKVKVGCGNLYITVNRDEVGLCEAFCNVGRAGGCPAQAEATSRLVSIALRSGVAPEAIVEQLRGIRCLSTVTAKRPGEIHVLSCPDAIGRAMEESLHASWDDPETVFPEACWECGSRLEHIGGRCVICRSCGWGRCF